MMRTSGYGKPERPFPISFKNVLPSRVDLFITKEHLGGYVRRFLFILVIGISQNAISAPDLTPNSDWSVAISGFAELDMIVDSTRSLLETIGNGPVSSPGTLAANNGRTQFSVRNSRLKVAVSPPTFNEWDATGFFEMDFLGYEPSPAPGVTTELGFFSNPAIRIRHAYGLLTRSGWSVLAGQFWTLFGWQPLYVPFSVSVNPVSGALYQRTPQLTLIKAFDLNDADHLQVGLSIVRPPQRDSQWPRLDAGLRFSADDWRAAATRATSDMEAQPFSIGASVTLRDVSTPSLGGGAIHYLAAALALNTFVPILSAQTEDDPTGSLSIVGEFTVGSGYGDLFPGWTGNLPMFVGAQNSVTPNLDAGIAGYDSGGNFKLVNLQSFSAGLQYYFPQGWDTFGNIGYAQLSSSNVGALTPNANLTPYNLVSTYFANLVHNFTSNFRGAVEVDYVQTKYTDSSLGYNYRFQASTWFRF